MVDGVEVWTVSGVQGLLCDVQARKDMAPTGEAVWHFVRGESRGLLITVISNHVISLLPVFVL